ncbi:MAG TPA: MBL fold metallo-hydrolase [Burkholderiales bacterium]|nr:MBL fold metallo-hydrolase [Burkholderiales bacterium]
MRFASLASGSSGNCLVAEAHDMACATRVLVDCGLNLRDTERRLARAGLEPSDIDAILVTHEHGDHAGCVFDFAAAHDVRVYLTRGTLRALKAEGKVHDGLKCELIRGEQKVAIGAMEVLPFTVPHDAAEPVQYILSDGAAKLGVLTDIGISTRHVEQTLGGLSALVLECNYDRDMLWSGGYPKWLKERIGGPFGHLDNREAARLLGGLERSKLKHIIGAHLSQQNNKPEHARSALAAAMNCSEDWIGLATQEDGFDWREA